MPLTSFFFLAIALFPGEICAQETVANNDVQNRIEEVYRGFTDHLKNGNAEGVAAFYTEDAKFYPPNGGVATGRQEISGVFNNLIQQGIHVVLESKELEVFGNVAYEYGTATIQNEQGDELGQNEYVVLWKKDGVDWKIYRDFIKDKAADK